MSKHQEGFTCEEISLLVANLKLVIVQNARKTLLWMFGMMSVFECALITALAKGFHWI